MTEFIRLQECFPKNGLQFQLIERSELAGLYKTYANGVPCGFEVVRIYLTLAHTTPSGKQCPAMERITSNVRFGFDGSRCFFSGEPIRARNYYNELVKKIEEQSIK